MTRETKSYELKIYDQSLMRFEAAYDAFGSLKLEITDIDSANAHLLPLNLIVDQDEKSLASWMEGRTIPKNRAFVEQILRCRRAESGCRALHTYQECRGCQGRGTE